MFAGHAQPWQLTPTRLTLNNKDDADVLDKTLFVMVINYISLEPHITGFFHKANPAPIFPPQACAWDDHFAMRFW